VKVLLHAEMLCKITSHILVCVFLIFLSQEGKCNVGGLESAKMLDNRLAELVFKVS